MRECKNSGEHVEDHLHFGAGESEDDAYRSFDRVAELALNYIHELIIICADPTEREEVVAITTIADAVVKAVRIKFQAQILYLRRCLKRQRAWALFWSEPRKLVEDPVLLKDFEQALLALNDPRLAATALKDLQQRFPSKRQLRLVKS